MTLSASIIYSLFLFFGMFSFAGATLLFIQFKNNKQAYVSSWIIGSILIGLATLLLALKSVLPEFISYKFSNGLNIAAYIYFYYTCHSLLGRQIQFKWLASKALIALVIFVALLLFSVKSFGAQSQPAIVAVGGLIFNFYTGLLTFQFYKRSHIQLSFALGVIFILTALVWGTRLLLILFYGLGFALEGGPINIITFTFLLLLGLAKYMSFVGLVTSIESSKKEELIVENHAMKLELAHKKAEQSESQLLASLNALAKARDNETGNHIIRTQNYVKVLALRLRSDGRYSDRLSDQAIDLLVRVTPLHDIGKIGIPDSVLLKKGSLTDEEWSIMKTHTLIGESVLGALEGDRDGDSDAVGKAILIAGGHHEKWDGAGYPRGLAGEAIPLEARIMSLADMYDALVSERVYKKAWPHEQAVQEIIAKRGTHFDPVIVDAFIAEQESFRKIAQQYRDS